VSLGFLKGRYVQLKALSHTEKFSRKMKLVRDIEAAMEECFDQDVEILYPPFPEAAYVSRATAELARLHGPVAIVSLPLRRSGKVTGVVTMERPKDLPFVVDEVESLRLTCDLCTARLANLHEGDRWFGARAAEAMRKTFSLAVGPKHTWAKVAAALVSAFLIYIFVAKGDYRANASFVLEARQQQMISAPFDGYIEAVYVEPGDKVISDQTVLAKLETTRLASDLDKARADLARAQIEADTGMRDGETAKAQDARAQAGKAQAEIEELGRLIREASIKSPITGTIVSPDIKRRVRGHVGLGDVMFEVAPVEFLRAELSVPEDEIADVVAAFEAAKKEGKDLGGQLATVGEPGKRVDFVVERINPVAEVEEKQNIFKVRVRLPEVQEGMRAGTRGVAKIDLGHRRYAYLWTRKLVNWVRMRLWL
jgi:multidrug efflux pump subunit AcrA (membrane-fusion protein)